MSGTKKGLTLIGLLDLHRMYTLLARIPEGLDPLRVRFESHVRKAGLGAIERIDQSEAVVCILVVVGSFNDTYACVNRIPKHMLTHYWQSIANTMSLFNMHSVANLVLWHHSTRLVANLSIVTLFARSHHPNHQSCLHDTVILSWRRMPRMQKKMNWKICSIALYVDLPFTYCQSYTNTLSC